MRVIIAGGRDYTDYDRLVEVCETLLDGWLDDEIIIMSGNCSEGADAMGETFADERGYKLELFPAEWHKYGRAAGPRRNVVMSKKADVLVAFWNGKSPGTDNMIHEAMRDGLEVHVYRYDSE